MHEPVYVTRAMLPDKATFLQYVDGIFASRQLTNNGPLVVRLEKKLRSYLNTQYISLCANGTLALMLALRASGLSGKKVIVTPFTYVATVNALLWEGCTPIFSDIDDETLCLSPRLLEKTLKEHPDAAGILPVHVYGIACDVEAIADLAKKYNTLVIYDAAHTFGETLNGRSLLDYGDIAICSFHATKVFHTAEGGCIICHNKNLFEKINLLRAFGHIGDNYIDVGINAKMSELHAAIGLSLIEKVDEFIKKREDVSKNFDIIFNNKNYRIPKFSNRQTKNYAYYPVIFKNEQMLIDFNVNCKKYKIYPRRYFYPSCDNIQYISNKIYCSTSYYISKRVLCIPIYPDIPNTIYEKINTAANLINNI